MPFTLSHPAAVLPLRRYGVLSALVIGSMMPDLLYFIPGVAKSNFGHTLTGIFVFCLPVGWLCFYLFQHYLKAPLVALAPERVQSRLSPIPVVIRVLPVTLSLLAGMFTHVAWDEFTHEGTWVTKRWPFFNRPIFFFGTNYRLRGFALLQDVSTIVGFFIVLASIAYWLMRTQMNGTTLSLLGRRIEKKGLMIGALLLGAALPGIFLALLHPEHWLVNERRQFLELSVTLGIAILLVELVGLGLWWHQTLPDANAEQRKHN